MLPELVRISNPNESDPAKAKEESLVISSYAVKEIISRLHQPHDFYEDTPGMLRNWFDEDAVLETVNGWIRIEHDMLWNKVVKELRKSSAALTSK